MAVLDNHVLGYLLDEASGNALDVYASNDLTATGSPGTSADGRTFNGSTQYFSKADNALFSMGDIDFDITFEFVMNSKAGFPVPFAKNGTTGGQHEYAAFYNTSSDRLTWSVESTASGAVSVEWGAALSTGVKYFARMFHDSVNNLVGIAIDGGSPVTASWSNGVADRGNAFAIGASPSQSLYWSGAVENFHVWKGRLLDSGEVTTVRTGTYPWSGGGGGPKVGARRLLSSKLKRLSLVG